MSLIYLDFNRTTPMAPSVIEAMQPYWSTHFMLPTQSHVHASAVNEAIESARESVAFLIGCEPFELVFTSGGTEANNLGILGAAECDRTYDPVEGPPHLLISTIEHDAAMQAALQLGRMGWDVELVPCDSNGHVDADEFEKRFRESTQLVCLQLANHVLGTDQPVQELADRCRHRGIRVHCDATSAAGKIPIDVTQLGVDTLAISAHKMYGPKGSGALFVRRGLELKPILFGESREMGLRAGSENVPAIVGFGCAASMAGKCIDDAHETLRELRSRLIDGLRTNLGDNVTIFAEHNNGLPNTVTVQMPVEAKRIQKAARHLVLASAQSESPPDEMTRVLRAIGCTDKQIGRCIRVSVGWTTSRDQIDRAVNLLTEASD
ncbi:cysteine desulfurase [Rhodopirellula sp. JC740]|uniref:Cysteine desulfurase n=1 Tax=Rhodopirellula halodulae TaxID=2894198 RepID=A0ABS8NMX6_9BACT|nr:cysteine desulfurase [Rhodopirellula sp. JC740]